MRLIPVFFALLIALTGCATRDITPEALPTRADINALATEIVLTENAPPAGFSSVAFPRIDNRLDDLNGWRYSAEFIFEGVFTSTTRTAYAETRVDVSYDRIGSARRVVAYIESNLQGDETEPVNYEAVQLGPDYFLVRDGNCLTNAEDDARVVADLSAGLLIGGVNQAQNSIQRAVINSENAWRYTFMLEDMLLPSIGLTDTSEILSMTGDLWVAPEHNAVIRYYVNLDVENVTIFGSTAPVSGTVLMRYDLYDVGTVPNLAVPFGC